MWWWKVQLAALRHFSILSLGASILQTLGVVWLSIQVTAFFWPSFEEQIRTLWWLFIGIGAIVGLPRAWPRLSVKSMISRTDAKIEVRVCNLFEQKAAFVVSSNTTFDTSIENGTISKTSTQGQYTERFCHGIGELNRQLDGSLNGLESEDLSEDTKPYGKRREYPIGTVADISCSGARAYFVALAQFDRNRTARATKEQILEALPKLWEFVRSRGNLEPIVIPIVGTGFARTQATREELIREIAKSFIVAARTGRFCEHLTIAISPDDYKWKGIDLPQIGRFLDHECTYDSSGSTPPPAHAESAVGEAVRQQENDGGPV